MKKQLLFMLMLCLLLFSAASATAEFDMPPSPITLETPVSMFSVVNSTVAPIKIAVNPGSQVWVNGVETRPWPAYR